VEARHRDVGSRGQLADHLVEPRRLLLGDRLGTAHLQCDLVAEPVRAEVEDGAEAEEEEGRLGPADREADDDEETGQRRQQDGGAEAGGEVRTLCGAHADASPLESVFRG
jgi:hypothetical protein